VTSRRRVAHVPRSELIAQLRNRLVQRGSPRVELLFILGLAGTVAFLVSAIGLRLGLVSMTVRYPLAAACGYLAFIVLIRAWIAWQRKRWNLDFELEPELLNVDVRFGRSSDVNLFQGGRSGGAGASGQWAREDGIASNQAAGGTDVDVDFDDLWPIVIAATCALGAVVAIVYVVYGAPLLLAEIALDGAVVTTLYRRMRRADAAHWAATTLRRTWISAVVLVVTAAIAGFSFEQLVPDDRSIGNVVRELIEAIR
jgi:hypothetical protein